MGSIPIASTSLRSYELRHGRLRHSCKRRPDAASFFNHSFAGNIFSLRLPCSMIIVSNIHASKKGSSMVKIYRFLLLIPILSCAMQAMQQLPFLTRIPQSVTIPPRWHKIHVPHKVKGHVLNKILRIEHLFLDLSMLEHDLCAIESHLVWPKPSLSSSIQFSEELYTNIRCPLFEYPAKKFTPLINALKNENNHIEFIDQKTNVVYAWAAPHFPLHLTHKALKTYSNQNQRVAEKMYSPWAVEHAEEQAYQQLISDVERYVRRYYDNVTIHVLKKNDTAENCLASCEKYHAKQLELIRLKMIIHESEVQLLASIQHNTNPHNDEL
jgi:hypothetical protein